MTKFLLFVDRSGQYRWTLIASNGEPITTAGEAYVAVAGCLNGIAVVRESGQDDWPVYTTPVVGSYCVFVDAHGEHRWRLYARNGHIVAVSSEGYRRQADAMRGIQLTKAAWAAPVERLAA
jgi:uncharacterized protein YegP (UPF0339 family)